MAGAALGLPGWTSDLGPSSFWNVVATALLNAVLMPFVALFASSGCGYLPPMGWMILSLAFADLIGVLGYADWFSWAVTVLVSDMVKTQAEWTGLHSYLVVVLTGLAGLVATLAWGLSADQTR